MGRPRWTMQLALLAVATALEACGPSAPASQAAAGREPDVRETITLDAPRMLAVGDSARGRVVRERCTADTCSGIPLLDPLPWGTNPAGIVRVDERGRMIARRPGRLTLTVEVEDTVLDREIEVVPKVAALAWEPASVRIAVGDTAWLRAVARNANGEEIASVPLSGVIGGSGVLQNTGWVEGRGTWVVGRAPGTVTLRAFLGPRRSEAVVTVG